MDNAENEKQTLNIKTNNNENNYIQFKQMY